MNEISAEVQVRNSKSWVQRTVLFQTGFCQITFRNFGSVLPMEEKFDPT